MKKEDVKDIQMVMGRLEDPGFAITRHQGFHIRFDNGWTVSVQFGPASYSGKYPFGVLDFDAPNREIFWHSKDAEIAAWDADGKWHKFDKDNTVHGFSSPDEVIAFMAKIAAKPK